MLKVIRKNPLCQQLMLAIISSIIFNGCKDTEVIPLKVQFERSLQSVSEGNEAIVYITLDQVAVQDVPVELIVETNSLIGQHFVTDPAIEDGRIDMKISSGQSQVSFKLTAIDNNSFDDGRYVLFTLANSNSEWASKQTLIIEDDEAPVVASFAEVNGIINEQDTDGMLVEIQLSSPAPSSGKIYVSSTNPGGFASDQMFSGNMMELPINEGDTKVGFRIVPAYDAICRDRLLSFKLEACFGSIKSGNAISYDLFIVDGNASSIAFSEASGSVNENNVNGKDIHLSILPAASEATRIFLSMSDNGLKNKYITNPAYLYDEVDGSYMVFDVLPGATSVTFKVIPDNNLVVNDDYVVDFGIFLVNNGCFKNPVFNTYRLTIVDDE